MPHGECAPCPPGRMAPQVGSSTCDECPAGKIAAAAGGTYCSACPPGSIQEDSGKAVCHPCPPGSVQVEEGETACLACPPGSYCPPGFVFPLPCPFGSLSDGSAASSSPADCLCAPGYFGGGGHAPCSVCSFGTYQRDFGKTSCTQCPPGTNTTFPAADNIELCSVTVSVVYTAPEVPVRVHVRLPGNEAATNRSLGTIRQAFSKVIYVNTYSDFFVVNVLGH